MVGFIGVWEAVILVFVILLLFGSTRFVNAARGLGKGAREFKKGVTGEDEAPKLPPEQRHDGAA
jgi:sec-independent protein translocase protein TatA